MERSPWHSYGVSLAIWDHTVLPANQHKWTHTALTPARQVGTQFTYPKGMEGWVDRLHARTPTWFTHPQMDTHTSTISAVHCAAWVELATCWSQVRSPNHYTTLLSITIRSISDWFQFSSVDRVCVPVVTDVLFIYWVAHVTPAGGVYKPTTQDDRSFRTVL